MKNNIHYSTLNKQQRSVLSFFMPVLCFLLLSVFTSTNCFGKGDPEYDEITIFISVQGVGSVEVPAVIYNDNVYLGITDLLDFLKIKNTISAGMDSVSGYFIDPASTFLIDKKNNRITYGAKRIELSETDLIHSPTNLYLRSTYFGQVFGLECTFNFRSLSVALNTKMELPVIREMRQAAMRNNIRQLKGEMKVDTSIAARSPLFHFGAADWSVVSTQDTKSGFSNTRVNLALGGIFAGGETTIGLNYDNNAPISEKQQYYLWRYVNNSNSGLRQVMAGKIFSQAAASIYSPVVGVQFTNTPTTYRRSFGTTVISNHTGANWMVELYVNNVLVDYVKADAAGFYTFEVPLVYGNSAVKLRFYGPWGEERTTEENIDIPFIFLPQKKFEYTAGAGMVEDSVHSRYSRANFNYGVSKRLTVGGGVEYLSSVTTGKTMPFVNASLRLDHNIFISGEYIHGVRLKNVLSYRMPSNLQFELSYSRYKKGQKAINNTYLEERRAVVSYPFRSSKLSLFSRLTLYQIVLPASKYTNAEILFSGVVFGVNTNLTTYALFNNVNRAYIYTNLSSTFRLPSKLIFTPQLQYEYNQHKFIGVKGDLGRCVSAHGYMNLFYENNFKSHYQSAGIAFRYDFSFAQMSFSARHGDHSTTTTQTARGSLVYNGENNYVGLNNRTSVGKGGIVIAPYLDINNNGRRDKDEPAAVGLRAQVSSGCVKYNTRDTSIIITDLEAYAPYIIKLNSDGFDNVAWQLRQQVLSITVNPDQFMLIEVPVAVMGEVSGTVFLEGDKGQKGLGRMLVNFYNSKAQLSGQTLSEADGFFSFAGLPAGTYTIRIDAGQLKKLNMESLSDPLPVTIMANREGDVIDGIKLAVKYLPVITP
jgi:hypothetical protein